MERIQGTVHDIQVVNRGSIKYMRFGSRGGWQGALDLSRPSRPVFPYQRAFAALLPVFDLTQYLSFGVGTGTSLQSVRAEHPDASLYGVELDEKVVDTAIQHFEAPRHGSAQYFVGNGLEFLAKTSEKFTLMFVDAYMSNRIYSPCLEPTVPQLIADALSESGIACLNFIMQYPATGAMAQWLEAAKPFFSSIYLLPVGIPYTEQNTLAIVAKENLPIETLRKALRSSEYTGAWEKITWPFRLSTV